MAMMPELYNSYDGYLDDIDEMYENSNCPPGPEFMDCFSKETTDDFQTEIQAAQEEFGIFTDSSPAKEGFLFVIENIINDHVELVFSGAVFLCIALFFVYFYKQREKINVNRTPKEEPAMSAWKKASIKAKNIMEETKEEVSRSERGKFENKSDVKDEANTIVSSLDEPSAKDQSNSTDNIDPVRKKLEAEAMPKNKTEWKIKRYTKIPLLYLFVFAMAGMMLFPPFLLVGANGTKVNMGYALLFDPPRKGRLEALVNVELLLTQFGVVTLIAFVLGVFSKEK